MADRTNRDRGRRKEHQKYRNLCGCWLCTDGKTKKRVLMERALRKARIQSSED